MLWVVWRYGVDVPVHDSWHMVLVFRKLVSAQWEWSDLFCQVNESRLPFPKLVIFGLALLTNWNVKAELFLQQGIMAALLAALYFVARQTLKTTLQIRLLVLAGTSLMLYSLVQYQNPLWGIQFIVFVPPLCLALGILVAYSGWRAWAKRVVAALCCVVGMYSFSNGLSLWIFVPLVVESVEISRRPARLRRHAGIAAVAFWVGCGVLAAWAYFHGYQRPPWHPKMTIALEHPWDAVRAFLLYFGSSVYDGSPSHVAVPALFGGVELAVAATVLGVLVRHRRAQGLLAAAAPWLAFLGFGLLSGVLIVAGRLGFSPSYSLAPRYVAFALWVHVGLLHIVALLLTRTDAIRPGTVLRRMAVLCGAAAGVGFMLLHALASTAAFPEYPKLHTERLQAKAALWLIDVTPQPDIKRLIWYGSSDGSTRWLGRWLDHRGYVRPPLFRDLSAVARDESLRQDVGWVDTVVPQAGGGVAAAGWCYLPGRQEACDTVLVTARTANGRDVACTVLFPSQSRPDAAAALNASPGINYGWSGTASCGPDVTALRFWAVDVGAPKLVLLRSASGPAGSVPAKGVGR
ncbi:MAG TPA: hypothetical protein VGK32_05275 [Vicinamibacterales bacterium]|jgi:hypothetical protein